MTRYTPAQARELAERPTTGNKAAIALRSLADQVEELQRQLEAVGADGVQALSHPKSIAAQAEAPAQFPARIWSFLQAVSSESWEDELGESLVADADAAMAWIKAAAPVVPAPVASAEPLIFDDFPEFHAEGMGRGLEDRNITDRYEAMRYGWDEALEAAGLNITGFLSDLPQAAPVAQLSEPQRPQNCGTGHCSCIECPFAAAPTTPKD